MCHGDVVQERSKLKSHLNSSPSATVKLAWASCMSVFPIIKTAKGTTTFEKLSESLNSKIDVVLGNKIMIWLELYNY